MTEKGPSGRVAELKILGSESTLYFNNTTSSREMSINRLKKSKTMDIENFKKKIFPENALSKFELEPSTTRVSEVSSEGGSRSLFVRLGNTLKLRG